MALSRWAIVLAGALAAATLPASLATGAQAALPASALGASEGTRFSAAQVQPRLIAAPSSQWAVLQTVTVTPGPQEPAILGQRTPAVTDDSVAVPYGSNQLKSVAILDPTLNPSRTIATGFTNGNLGISTESQGDDTVWMTEDNWTSRSWLVSVNARTSVVTEYDAAVGGQNVRDLVGMSLRDDTLYVGYQLGSQADCTDTYTGVMAFSTSNPNLQPALANNFQYLQPGQLSAAKSDDTLILAARRCGNGANNTPLAIVADPRSNVTTALPMPWNSYGAAAGDDTIYLAQHAGKGLIAVNPKRTDDSVVVQVPGAGQLLTMDVWRDGAPSDDTIFITDISGPGRIWVLNSRTLAADDSVTLDAPPSFVTVARADLVYASGSARVSAIGTVSGTSIPATGTQDDSITINLALPELFTQDDSLVTNVWLDDSVTTKATLVRNGNTIQAKVPPGTGGPYSVLVGLNGGNRIKVGEFTYAATVTFDPNGGSGSMASQTASSATNLTANTFTRSGYNFAGWNTAANGSGTAYADQASYSFTSNVTLYAQWTAIPPRPPRPIPTPTPSPTPTPDPTPSPVPVPTPLEPGDSELTVDGVPRPVQVNPNTGDNGLDIQGDGWTMDLDGLGPNGAPLNLGPDGVLRVQVGRDVQTEGTGFKPESDVGLFLNPPPASTTSQAAGATWFRSYFAHIASGTSIGMVRVDAQGDFLGSATLPRDIKPGTHVLQAVGFGPSGDTRALSLGVLVEPSLVLDQGVRIKGKGRIHDRINTTGSSTGIDEGTRLTPYIRYTGQKSFTKGKATIVVAADGTFRWTRQIRRDKGVTGYVAYRDLTSNQVTWVRLS